MSTSNAIPWTPALDMRETANAYYYHVDLPGIEARSVRLQVQGGQVRLSAERHAPVVDGEWRLTERQFGPCERLFALPDDADPGQVYGHFEHGEMVIHVLKREDLQFESMGEA